MLNPYASLDPYRSLYQSSLDDPAQQASPIQPLTQSDEDSLLSKIGGATLGGIGWAGRHLEPLFGGRAIRGVLGGHPDELGTLIPFSDEMGLTDYSRRVSGQQLLGLQGNKDWGSWLAGLGTEIATDPASYLSFGGSALTDAGNVASKIGALPESVAGRAGTTLSDLLAKSPELTQAAETAAQAGGSSLADLSGQRLGGLVGLGLPFQRPSAILGASQGGADLANAIGQGASYLGRHTPGLPWLNQNVVSPVSRTLAMLFNPDVGGTLSEGSQQEARAMAGRTPAEIAAAKQQYLGIGNPLLEAGMLGTPQQAGETSDALTAVLENRASPLPATPQGQALGASSALARDVLDARRAAGVGVGRPIGEVENYAPRQMTPLDRPTRGYGPSGGQDFPVTSPNQRGRLESFRDLPKPVVNALSVDPAVSGPDRLIQNGAAYIRHNYLGGSPTEDQDLLNYRAAPPVPPVQTPQGMVPSPDYERWQALEQKDAQSKDLADIMAGMDPKRAAEGKPLFANNQLSDIGTYLLNDVRAQQGALARHNILAAGGSLAQPTNDTVSAMQALEQAGLGHDTGAMVGQTPTGGQATLLDTLKQRGVLPGGAADLSGVRISNEALADAVRYGSKGFQAPPALRPLLNAYDSMTNLTKGWMSSFWPSSIIRDITTGLWQHSATGIGSPADALSHMAEASTLRQGQTVAGAAAKYFPQVAGLTDEAASKALRDEMFVHDAWGRGGQASDLVGVGTHEKPGGPLLPNAPDAARQSLLSEANPLNALPRSWAEANPLALRGVGGARETLAAPVRYGQELRDSIYETQMGGGYLSGRAQGFAPAEAAKQSLATNYDYGNLTPFENNVMRRVMPYYSWARRNIPNQIGQLLTHPGGMASVEARSANDLRGQGLLPESVRDELAIPVGQEQGGLQRYLSRLDLPPEDLFGGVQQGPKQWQDMAMGVLGETNPLIKGPLELATGKQFYSGRDIGDLFSTSGNGALEQLLMNSPASRVLSTGRALVDPRKDLLTKVINVGTGARLTDVNMDQARNVAARQYIEDALSQRPEISHFENVAIRKGQEGNLTPEEVALLRLNKTLEQAAQQRVGVRR